MGVRKNLTGWKQGHNPVRFGAPAFGGGFFLNSVIHKVSGPKPCLGLAKAAHSTIPSASVHTKKPGVTRTTGWVMGES